MKRAYKPSRVSHPSEYDLWRAVTEYLYQYLVIADQHLAAASGTVEKGHGHGERRRRRRSAGAAA